MASEPHAAPVLSESLVARLRRWANARERRNTPGGHGKTGTALLRDAADRLEAVHGNVYLWRVGEIDAEKAMEGVRDALGL